jgi:tetratricopeptide (TPR) repeat protein
MRTTITILVATLVSFAAGCAHNSKQAYTPDEYFRQGLANENAGNTQRAMIHYGQAIDADPMHAPSLYHLGVLQTNSCDYDRAIPTWRQYVHATHNSGEAWSNLGWTYEKMGWQRNAEGAYRSGIIANSASKACQTNLGLFLARHGEPNEALIHLQTAMTSAQAHQNLAMIYREQGLDTKADLEITKANGAAPSSVATNDDEDNEDVAFELDDTELDNMQQSQSDAPSIEDAQSQIDETDLLINPDPH